MQDLHSWMHSLSVHVDCEFLNCKHTKITNRYKIHFNYSTTFSTPKMASHFAACINTQWTHSLRSSLLKYTAILHNCRRYSLCNSRTRLAQLNGPFALSPDVCPMQIYSTLSTKRFTSVVQMLHIGTGNKNQAVTIIENCATHVDWATTFFQTAFTQPSSTTVLAIRE
jgi:hypothetical protein